MATPEGEGDKMDLLGFGICSSVGSRNMLNLSVFQCLCDVWQ